MAIDLRMLFSSGIGTYIRNLVPRVIEALPITHWYLLGHPDQLQQCPWTQGPRMTIIPCTAAVYSVREQMELFANIPGQIDLFWSHLYNVPLGFRGRLLLTLHDVAHVALAQTFSGLHKRLYARLMTTAATRKAAVILTSSEFTRSELRKFFGAPVAAKTHVTPLGVSAAWRRSDAPTPHPKPYILAVGNLKPNKNLSRLIQAYASVAPDIPHDLVLVGQQTGFITADPLIAGAVTETIRHRVHFTGPIDDAELARYYQHAEMLVFPSLYEGFGLPPLEAMAVGCPVVVSRLASLPEVCGEAALYCDPYVIPDIAEKMLSLIRNPALRETLRHQGLRRAGQMTWDSCAAQTLHIIRQHLPL